MASTRRKTTLAFIATYQNLDADANVALRTPDCRHAMAPSSLGFPPTINNEQFAAHMSSVKPLLAHLPVTANEIFEHPESNQVTIWATSEATFHDEVKDDSVSDWSYHGEYIFILFFNRAGDRIERIIEFHDSKRAAEIGVLLEQARKNLAAREAGV